MINITTSVLRPASQFLNTNAPAIFTAFGAVGVVGTAVLTARATFEAGDRLREQQYQKNLEENMVVEIPKFEKVKLVWLLYLPPATTGVLSIAAIVLSHRISSKRAAVLAAAYALNEGKLEEYQEKVREKFGDKKAKEVESAVNQEQINRISDAGFQWADPTAGKVWIVEAWTGAPFLSTIETVNKAVNEVNNECIREGYVRLSEFYDAIGLKHTQASDQFGFNRHEQLELSWDTGTSPDGSIPVHVFQYVNHPVLDPGDGSFR
jgi:hypothetical protein